MAKTNRETDEIVDEAAKNEIVEMSDEPETDQETPADEEATTEPEVSDDPETEPEEPKGPNVFQRALTKYKAKKKITIPLTVLFVALLLAAIPFTRYALAGVVLKKNFEIKVIDSRTSIPVSGVEVSLRGKTAKTDGEGKATLSGVKVGSSQLKATKKHYKDTTAGVTVPLGRVKDAYQVKLEATGRQIPLHVTNKITGQSLPDATVKAADTEVQTDKEGQATIVLPPGEEKHQATVSAKGFNDLPVDIKVSELAVQENTFALTPAGKVYFLSKKTGSIDVVKTDLDGQNRQTVLAGTGKEEETNTILLASRDWKYLALLSRREDDKARLYLIETGSDKLSEIDSGDASFAAVGWHEHTFVYQVNRNKIPLWQPKQSALKSFNADTKQLATLDETNAEGAGDYDYVSETLGNVYIVKDGLVYSKAWSGGYGSGYRLAGKRSGIYKVKTNGSEKQQLKDIDIGTSSYISAVIYKPEEIYFAVYRDGATNYFEYENGKIEQAKDATPETFNKFYPTFLVSPSAQSTFWYEPRDGKNSLFVGPANGENGKEIASLSEYVAYGWYTDDYLLVSKDSSELYILPASGPADKIGLLKVTDYHKPAFSFNGYGYGYGGF